MRKIRNIYLKDKIILNENHQFILLHHFRVVNSNYFKRYEELLYSNEKNKYSIFGFFDDSFRIQTNTNNEYKFIFLLEYPEAGYIYFEQDENPLTAAHDSEIGMKTIESTLPVIDSSLYRPFSGLTKYEGKYNSTFLDGFNSEADEHNGWYYPIGQRISWYDQIPCYIHNSNAEIMEVNLWIEFNDYLILDKFKNLYSCKSRQILTINLYTFIITMFLI